MTSWMKVQALPPEFQQKVQAIYTEPLFPLELRANLAGYIDSINWISLNPDDPTHFKAITKSLWVFITKIETFAGIIESDFVLSSTLVNIAEGYKGLLDRGEHAVFSLYRKLRNCLLAEMNIIRDNERKTSMYKETPPQVLANYNGSNPMFLIITDKVETIRAHTQATTELFKRYDIIRGRFMSKFNEYKSFIDQRTALENQCQLIANQMIHPSAQNLYTALMNKISNAENEIGVEVEKFKEFNDLLAKMISGSDMIASILSSVIDQELIGWKREQQLAGNGLDFDVKFLDILQTWCEQLAEIILINLLKIKEAMRISRDIAMTGVATLETQTWMSQLTIANKKYTENLSKIVLNTFILEKQPPQVMKTNTRFNCKIRFLVGAKLNIQQNLPSVNCTIITEPQANGLLKDKQLKGDLIGDMMNSTATMEYDSSSKQLSVTFRNMQLKKIKRTEKKGSESVVDEKFCLFFTVKFVINGELDFVVWTMSLPVAVIVHGNQEPHAWSSIMWDNAFAEPGRAPFVTPDKVPWGKVANALNVKFQSVTGQALKDPHLKYLAEKLFRNRCDDYDTMMVTWSNFSKETLDGRAFTFWDWFFAVMKLTKEHLKAIWNDGLIEGFMDRNEAAKLLYSCPGGTFLLRFSDSELGGISVAWVDENSVGERTVQMIHPFTTKDFGIRALADRIFDLDNLLYLYPARPKDEAFGRHYSPEPNVDQENVTLLNYVKANLVTTLPRARRSQSTVGSPENRNGCNNSYPPTPQVQSPEIPPSSMTEVIGGGGWQCLSSTIPTTMEYDGVSDFAGDCFSDFSLQNPSLPDVQSRTLHNYN